jgi:hypothetical protein
MRTINSDSVATYWPPVSNRYCTIAPAVMVGFHCVSIMDHGPKPNGSMRYVCGGGSGGQYACTKRCQSTDGYECVHTGWIGSENRCRRQVQQIPVGGTDTTGSWSIPSHQDCDVDATHTNHQLVGLFLAICTRGVCTGDHCTRRRAYVVLANRPTRNAGSIGNW